MWVRTTLDGMFIFTIYISPGRAKKNIQNVMRTQFSWVKQEKGIPFVLVAILM